MQIESIELKRTLIKQKEAILQMLDRSPKNKVKEILDSNISLIESFLIWISNSEKTGEVNMDNLKLGEIVRWEPKQRRGSIDPSIIQDSKQLKKNFDAIKITSSTVKWTSLVNRVYALRKDGKIPNNIVPRKNEEGQFLVYLEEPPKKRAKA